MPVENNRLFFISGFASLFFFSVSVLIVVWQAKVFVQPLAYASVKSEVISVSLDSPAVTEPMPKSEISEEVAHVKPEMEKVVKHDEVKQTQPQITDLFSKVKVANSPKESKQSPKELSELNALEEKVLSMKRSSKLFEKAKSIDLAKMGVKVIAPSSGPLVNEYYAKVQGIIYANFHPASGTQGFSARVRIVLSADGKLDSYRVISSSGNGLFNAEVDWLKERLRQVSLPQNPNGDEAIFEIILTAKD